MKTTRLSLKTWRELNRLKKSLGLHSLDEVIKYLLEGKK